MKEGVIEEKLLRFTLEIEGDGSKLSRRDGLKKEEEGNLFT